MVVKLIGGPLDGAIIDGPSNLPAYMVVSDHLDSPIYKAGCCGKCGQKRQTVPYFFHGYKPQSAKRGS